VFIFKVPRFYMFLSFNLAQKKMFLSFNLAQKKMFLSFNNNRLLIILKVLLQKKKKIILKVLHLDFATNYELERTYTKYYYMSLTLKAVVGVSRGWRLGSHSKNRSLIKKTHNFFKSLIFYLN